MPPASDRKRRSGPVPETAMPHCPRLRPHRRAVLLGLTAFACVDATAGAAERAAAVDLPAPDARATCPVCGMFVANYPYWVASARFRDGRTLHFDGGKDLWKFLLDVPRWAAGRTAADVAVAGVTTYYDNERVAADRAWYVIGSDVLGPMGHELVPHASEADAAEFMTDHKGRRILQAADITLPLLGGLDVGRFL